MTQTYINHNGSVIKSDQTIVTAENRGLRYGDGLFETMRVSEGVIRLASLHFERLLEGCRRLKFELPALFSPENLGSQILALCHRNGHLRSARVRLMVFRGEGGLYDPVSLRPHYVIQTWALPVAGRDIHENGLVTAIFEDGRKACDQFSNLKSSSFLLYAMAALHARENRLNDVLILNSHDRICESTIANIFWVKEGLIHTPPLTEGCVAGVMRNFIFRLASSLNIPISEDILHPEDLSGASEVFLTNAIQGIRWIYRLEDHTFSNQFSRDLYRKVMENIF